jgi:hypothetical protein
MPRNSSGVYSLPAGNPVATGTPIAISWANGTMPDLGTALTDSLSRSGDGGMLAPLELDAGVVAAPGLTFSAETTLGMYRVAAGAMGFAAGGSKIVEINTTGLGVVGSVGVTGDFGLTGDLGVTGTLDVGGITTLSADLIAEADTLMQGTLTVVGASDFTSVDISTTALITGVLTNVGGIVIDSASTASLSFAGTRNTINFDEDEQAADERKWRIDLQAKVMNVETVSDDGLTTRSGIGFTRGTGVALSSVTIGNTTDNPTLNLRCAQVEFNDGSDSAPSITNSGDENTGFYFPAADDVWMSLGGTGYAIGYRGVPINTQNGSYSTLATDNGKCIYKASGGAGETITVDNAVASVNDCITIANRGGGVLTVVLSAGTLTLAGIGDVASIDLADDGLLTLLKLTTTVWIASGAGATET